MISLNVNFDLRLFSFSLTLIYIYQKRSLDILSNFGQLLITKVYVSYFLEDASLSVVENNSKSLEGGENKMYEKVKTRYDW